jgi:hypothetical protein
MSFNPDLFLNKKWRVNTLYTIVDKNGRQVPFRQNVLQEKVFDDRSRRKMILKARQFGFSTNEIVDMFDDICFTRNATYVILAHEQDSIKKLFRIVQRLYKFMPEEIRPRLDRGGGSKYEMYFPELNSRIYCDLESRSDTMQRLLVSECAFMKDSAKLKATLQAVPLNGRVTIETTANGMANHFYDMWIDPNQPYQKFFFPWFIFPEYKMPAPADLRLTDEEIAFVKKAKKQFNFAITKEQIAYRRFKKAELKASSHDKTRVSFEQEYPEDDITCFLSSGETVMDLGKIKKMLDSLGEPLSDNEGVKVYKEYDRTKTYVCGADIAEGIRKDFSVGVMIEVETRTVVAKIRGQWKPGEFADKLFEFCERYSSAGRGFPILAVERNNHGHAVILKLNEILGYPALFVNPLDERLGWLTSSVTRPIMINALIDWIEDGHLVVNDKEILTECLTLIDDNGKIEAASGKHDDSFVATAIALQIAIANSLTVYDNLENRIRI